MIRAGHTCCCSRSACTVVSACHIQAGCKNTAYDLLHYAVHRAWRIKKTHSYKCSSECGVNSSVFDATNCLHFNLAVTAVVHSTSQTPIQLSVKQPSLNSPCIEVKHAMLWERIQTNVLVPQHTEGKKPRHSITRLILTPLQVPACTARAWCG